MADTAVIIGASNGLGKAIAIQLAEKGMNCILSSRNEKQLASLADELKAKYNISAHVCPVDIGKLDVKTAAEFVGNCYSLLNSVNQVYITAAIVSEDDYGLSSINTLQEANNINYTGAALLISSFSERMKDKPGNITVISSIAAIRPRGRNINYAASKIALEYFVKGLRHFFADNPLKFQVYRVGYMDTAMTAGKKLLFKKENPADVAKHIVNRANRFSGLKYYPRFWWLIAIVLKSMPWFIYKKIKF